MKSSVVCITCWGEEYIQEQIFMLFYLSCSLESRGCFPVFVTETASGEVLSCYSAMHPRSSVSLQ